MIANLAEDYSAHQILEEYKDQSSVEIRLNFQKTLFLSNRFI